jgi:phosphatidyl-myo-inositol dimannoside synthase
MRKQPWRYVLDLATQLINYVDVRIMTNKTDEIDRDFQINGIKVQVLQQNSLTFPTKESIVAVQNANPNIIYWFGNALSGIYITRHKSLHLPVILHVSQAPFSIIELLRLGHRKIWDFRYDLLSTLIPMNWVIRRLNCESIKAITVSSKSIGLKLINSGVSPNKVLCAPLTYDPWTAIPIPRSNAKKVLRIKKETFVITYFGGSDTIRGTDIIVKSALKLMKEGLHNFLVVLLIRRETEIADRDELFLQHMIKRYCLEDNVKIVSKILTREELALYLFGSDLVVLPFKVVPSEPPLSVLEALSLGRTVITSNVSGLTELVDSSRGILVRPCNVEELVRAIYYLMKSPCTRNMLAIEGQKFVSNLSGFENLASWTLSRLTEAIN